MKSTIIKSSSQGKTVVTFFMFCLLATSLILTSFHYHRIDSTTDNCPICSFQTSYSAVTFEQTPDSSIFQKPLLEHAVTNNENVTNPSQKRVCSSHAPPQFC